MTLVALWVQSNNTLRQLNLISDSRLSGGESWDACPKIVPLPRQATAVAMSGDAVEAYLFLLQAINTCNLLDGNVSGRTDLGYLARKLREVYADSRKHVRDLPFGELRPSTPDLNVVLCGWSWRHLRFEGFSYTFDKNGDLQMQALTEVAEETANGVYFFGDAAATARLKLKTLIHDRALPVPVRGDPDRHAAAKEMFLNWEPLEILLDVINDPTERTVGGHPQIISTYQYGETECFVWRASDGSDHFGGRPVGPKERFDRRIMSIQDNQVKIQFSDRSIASAG